MGWVTKNAKSGRGLSAVKKTCVFGVVALAAAVARPAQGALSVTISEAGYAPVTQVAGVGTYSVVYATPYGDFITNLVVGYDNANTPGSLAQLQVQSLDVVNATATSATPKLLNITLTESNFTFPGAAGVTDLLSSSLGGTITGGTAGDKFTFQSTATPLGGSSVTSGLQSYTDPVTNGNALSFNMPTALATFPQTGTFALSNTIVAAFTTTGETVNLSGTSTVSVAPVPEPVGMSVLAVAGLALGRRRRAC